MELKLYQIEHPSEPQYVIVRAYTPRNAVNLLKNRVHPDSVFHGLTLCECYAGELAQVDTDLAEGIVEMSEDLL